MNSYCQQLYRIGISFLYGVMIFSASLSAQDSFDMEGALAYPAGKSFVIYDFGKNTSEINNIHSYITKILANQQLCIREIEIVGYSSPEGDYKRNDTLAHERAESLHKYLLPFFPDIEFRVSCVPEDWVGLINVMAQTESLYTETIRTIALADLTPVQKERKLRKLPRRIYKKLCQSYFPLLRRASITIYCDKKPEQIAREESTQTESVFVTSEIERKESYLHTQYLNMAYSNGQLRRQNIQNIALAGRYGDSYNMSKRSGRAVFWEKVTPVIAVGTDLLQWAGFRPDFTHTTFIPNVYLEYYFLKQWSVKGAFSYCNRSYDNDSRFQGISSYSIEPRFWLQREGNFRGFFFGIYGQFGDYNEQQSVECYTGKYHSEGLSAGYLFPLYKGLAVELNLRGGYRHSSVKRYKAGEECNNLCREYKKRDLTITGSSINLLYRF